ncbi:MAG: hypothetical protein KDN22_24360 [Verrucomicrobiae bacterium]|nr:hypothetical protein [Verrucomicrobiae bacterium]
MKIDQKSAFRISCAFVLLVGTEIAVLSPAIFRSNIAARSQRTIALAKAKQIHIGLCEYAIDHDGVFPAATSHSNDAFRQLDSPRDSDRLYVVTGSRWSEMASGRGKANLGRGENHWAYASGLNNGSKGNLPLVMDGFSDTIGVYIDDPTRRGGVWRREAAIIVRADGSAKMEKPEADGRVYEMKSGRPVDIFSKEYGTDPGQLLNPW